MFELFLSGIVDLWHAMLPAAFVGDGDGAPASRARRAARFATWVVAAVVVGVFAVLVLG